MKSNDRDIILAVYAILAGFSLAIFLDKKALPYLFGTKYKVGQCLALDAPKWIDPQSPVKIVDKEGNNYRVLIVEGGDAGRKATIRNTVGSEFQVTFRGADNVETQKVFLKVKVVDCPLDTKEKE